jgi:GR25 family glycosyltransferase involved in LPS biosynthesis
MLFNIYKMRKFYINLSDDHARRQKFIGKGYHRWEAVSRDDVPEELDKKMTSFYNFPRDSHLGRCGCFMSHYELYKYIVELELNDVLICEDDAVQVKDLPKEYPKDGIIYLGGFLHQTAMMDQSKVNINFKEGINYVKGFRVLMTMSYIIPRWEIAQEILDYIDARPSYRAIDIMLGNMGVIKYLEYPACFVEEGSDSTISSKKKKSNEHYEWVKI